MRASGHVRVQFIRANGDRTLREMRMPLMPVFREPVYPKISMVPASRGWLNKDIQIRIFELREWEERRTKERSWVYVERTAE